MKKLILAVMSLAVVMALGVISFGASGAVDISEIAKDYPYKKSALQATVLGTPVEQHYKFKNKRNFKVRKFEAVKEIPEILSDWKNYEYGIMAQKEKAPLIILISGTGGLFKSDMTLYFANVFYEEGYNVLAFSSPTTMPYIVSQSEYAYAGYIKEETEHLYDLIVEAIEIAEEKDGMKISGVYVGGYSLGGFQSLLLHEKDSSEKKIGIEKSLLLNTPVSILTATQKLDSFLIKNGIYDKNTLEKYLDTKFSRIYNSEDMDLNELDSKDIIESSEKLGLGEKDYEILIGLLFRFFNANMTFSGDVMMGKAKYKKFDSLTKRFHQDLSISFDEYVEDYVFPEISKKYPNKNFAEFVHEFNLKNSQDFIDKHNEDIIFIGSEDDFLLSPEDLEYVKGAFENRVLLPFGGHVGVLWHRDVVQLMLDKLEGNQ